MNKKRLFSVALVIVMVLSLIGCESKKQKAYSISKETYNAVNSAYELVDKMGSDIYEAWRQGIYSSKSVSITTLGEKLNLTEDELKDGVIYEISQLAEVTEADVTSVIKYVKGTATAQNVSEYYFDLSTTSTFSACVNAVTYSYIKKGTKDEIQKYLDEAKTGIKKLGEEYSDYENYPTLKEFYTTTCSYFEYCQDPSGTFLQAQNTINDYRNSARDYINSLKYVFEE